MTTDKEPLPLSEEEMKEIAERASKATEGPWLHEGQGQIRSESLPAAGSRIAGVYGFKYLDDAEFAACARQDVPRLLATIKELQRQLTAERTLSSHYLPPIGKE